MGRLIYATIMSLDGFIADENGNFDWAAPDEEVHRFVNELVRPVGTYLYGRRMYETMVYWETEGDDSDIGRDYAKTWRAVDKIIYSRTLEKTSSARTRIEHDFDVEAVRRMKATADRDLAVGGPELAGHALRAGLIDELHIFIVPVLVGAGNRALRADGKVMLRLSEERRFSNGTIFLRFTVDR